MLFIYFNQENTDTIAFYDNRNESHTFTMDKKNPDIENLVKWLNQLQRDGILEESY